MTQHLPISTNEDNMRGLDSVKKDNEAITNDENMSVPMSMEVEAQSLTESNTNLDNDGIHYSRPEGFHETQPNTNLDNDGIHYSRSEGFHETVRLNHSLHAATMEAPSELTDIISGGKHIAPEQMRRMQEHQKKGRRKNII